jgi:hypothetical protein
MTCASLGCKYAIHTNPANNGGSHCCQACKTTANKHGSACEKISITPTPATENVSKTPTPVARAFLANGPTFNLANCSMTQEVIDKGLPGKTMTLTVAWNRDPYATSYKVIVGKGLSPIIMNSVIDNNFIDHSYFIVPSLKNDCKFVDEYTVVADKKAFMTRNIVINKSDFPGVDPRKNNGWHYKIKLNITVIAYNKTTRGPTPKTVGILECLQGNSNDSAYAYASFLAIKHNITVTQAKLYGRMVANRYIFNNLFRNVKTTIPIKSNARQFIADNDEFTFEETYKAYTNQFSDLNLISIKDLVPGGSMGPGELGLPKGQVIIRTPARDVLPPVEAA